MPPSAGLDAERRYVGRGAAREAQVTIELLLLLLVGLLLLSGFFSSSETAFVSLDRVRLEHYRRERRGGAARVAGLLERPGRLLSAILLGNNLVNTGSAAVGTLIAAQLVAEGQAALIATLGITVLLMVFGEIGPKTIALHHDWSLARAYAVPLSIWSTVMRPFVSAFDLLGRTMVRLAGGEAESGSFSVAELRTAIRMGTETGELARDQSQMLLGALAIQQRPVSGIMVHRTEIVSVAADEPLVEVARRMHEHGYLRLPVYEGHPDEIIGIAHISDVSAAFVRGELDRPAREIVRDVVFDSELASIASVLERMKQRASHLAILTDEYGSISGMVTLEDVVEEVLGQIRSESGGEPEHPAVQVGERRVVEGRRSLGELGEDLGTELSHPGVETVGGLTMALLGRFPRIGEELEHAGHRLTVLDVDERRVKQVAIERLPHEPEASEDS
jgi:putative hemolysin